MLFSYCRTTEADQENLPALEASARDFAKLEGYRVSSGKGGGLTLSRGSWWALHRDEIRHFVRIGPAASGRVQVSVNAFAPFFDRAWLARFVERRMETLGRSVGLRTGPGPSETGRIPARPPPVRPGVFLSMLLAAVCSAAAALPFAFAIVESARARLLSACALARGHGVFLPGTGPLEAMTLMDGLASSLVVAAAAGFVSFALAMPILVAAETNRHWSRALPFALAGVGAAVAAVASFGAPAPWFALIALSPPAALAGWAIPARARLGGMQPHVLLWHAGAAFACAALLFAGVLALSGGNDVFTRARDRFLLTNRLGRALSDFYYQRSLLAARAVQSPSDPNRQKLFLALVEPGMTLRSIRRTADRMFGVVVHLAPGPEALAAASSSAVDAILVSEGWFCSPLAPSKSTLESVARAPIIRCDLDGGRNRGQAGASGEKAMAAELDAALQRGESRKPLAMLCMAGSGLAAVCWPAFLLVLCVSAILNAGFSARMAMRRASRPGAGAAVFTVFVAAAAVAAASPFALLAQGRGAVKARDLASGDHPPGHAAASLAGMLASPEEETRYEAAFGLYRLLERIRLQASGGGSGGVESFLEARTAVMSREVFASVSAALSDPAPRVRMWVAASLGPLGDAEAAEALVSMAKNDQCLNVRYRAAFALGQAGRAETTWELTRIARDESEPWYLRLYALRAVTGR